jgi:hypothetical protein
MARDADCSEKCVFRPKETGYVKQAQLVAYLRFRFGQRRISENLYAAQTTRCYKLFTRLTCLPDERRELGVLCTQKSGLRKFPCTR